MAKNDKILLLQQFQVYSENGGDFLKAMAIVIGNIGDERQISRECVSKRRSTCENGPERNKRRVRKGDKMEVVGKKRGRRGEKGKKWRRGLGHRVSAGC